MSDAVDELRTAIVPVNSEEPDNGQALTARRSFHPARGISGEPHLGFKG